MGRPYTLVFSGYDRFIANMADIYDHFEIPLWVTVFRFQLIQLTMIIFYWVRQFNWMKTMLHGYTDQIWLQQR